MAQSGALFYVELDFDFDLSLARASDIFTQRLNFVVLFQIFLVEVTDLAFKVHDKMCLSATWHLGLHLETEARLLLGHQVVNDAFLLQ